MSYLTKSAALLAASLTLLAGAASAATVSTYVSGRQSININPADGYRPGNVGGIDFSGQVLDFTATGEAYYGGYNNRTTADGRPDYAQMEGLTALALIGVFSSTSGTITAIGDRFLVGTAGHITAPTSGSGPAYLFLGYNDNYYGDNGWGFSTTINYNAAPPAISAVPLPAGGLLLLSALGLGAAARRRKTA